ncbi:hypothetical protein GCM10010156_28920 [Planobispora rosea]|uniref:Uncharacterized protein n=1 Tax=Planobispora rosea TaxID=35762 RepID=A0A8J3WAM7_PLARO|nr:hypothetical protein GCM10010156_28920 [Planobispora rosea]GIH81977.1 hypothetical protein Pro02_03850 [Planobispora rosea]
MRDQEAGYRRVALREHPVGLGGGAGGVRRARHAAVRVPEGAGTPSPAERLVDVEGGGRSDVRSPVSDVNLETTSQPAGGMGRTRAFPDDNRPDRAWGELR